MQQLIAVVTIRNQQHKITPTSKFVTHYLCDTQAGQIIKPDNVLFTNLENNDLHIELKVLKHYRGSKIKSLRFKRRKNVAKWYSIRPINTQLQVVTMKGKTIEA